MLEPLELCLETSIGVLKREPALFLALLGFEIRN